MKPSLPLLVSLLIVPALLADDETLAKLKEKPITTAQAKVGDLLRQWWKEGTAAGNVGDFYDNRDGAHSMLDTAPYPQLQSIVYSPEDIKLRKHWAGQRVLVPGVVFGNSSTSAPPTQGGSNVRMYYTNPAGLAFLYKQYTSNNLYIYPEHRDHDPGHNGAGDGFGDLYPTNTPYLVTSQGSSGSDQPFMRAVPFTLAAFRPEVKKTLVGAGALMPTVQMILRRTSKLLKDPADYLTGKAHPTVFEGSAVDELAMVKMAHDLQPDNLPPLIRLKVLEEDQPTLGRDFFDMHTSEKLGDTPCAIARIFRGKEQKRRMLVSAQDSVALDKKPLTYTWVILRGDPKRITIKPRNEDRSEAEIVVSYHERRPIAAGSPLESNRVDIGVFAHNGTHHSAPAFVTWYSLDSEGRQYDDKGRIVEIGYGMGTTTFAVTHWTKFLDAVAGRADFLKLKAEDRELFAVAQKRLGPLRAELDKLKTAHAKASKETDKDQLAVLKKRLDAASKSIDDLLDGRTKDLPHSIRALASRCLDALAGEPDLLARSKETSPKPRRPANLHSVYERNHQERLHGAFLADHVFPGCLTATFHVNFVDQRLTTPRDWRDVYRYDDKGSLLGWTRFDGKERHEFTAAGDRIVEKDKDGRSLKACSVRYVQDPIKGFGLNTNPLRQVDGPVRPVD